MMTEWLNGLVELAKAHPDLIVWIVGGLTFAESLGLVSLIFPFMIPLIGVVAVSATTGQDPLPIFISATAGATVGYQVSYYVGIYFKDSFVHVWPFSRVPDHVTSAQALMAKWGGLLIYPSHFTGPLRGVVPTLIGASGMGHLSFTFHNVVSSTAWAVALIFFREVMAKFFV
jgi:membrane protein DedA with SNARE-associated domain